MNMPWTPGDRERGRIDVMSDTRVYRVSMRISVTDAGLLWRMATARALAFADLTETEIEDMLGPVEDPSVADCIAMLLGPRLVAGCSCDSFDVSSADMEEEEA